MGETTYWVAFDILERFMCDVFVGLGVPQEDATVCADILITSDKRGIDSHGISRMKPIYYDRIKLGIQQPVTHFEIIKDTETTAVVDGHHGNRNPGYVRHRPEGSHRGVGFSPAAPRCIDISLLYPQGRPQSVESHEVGTGCWPACRAVS